MSDNESNGSSGLAFETAQVSLIFATLIVAAFYAGGESAIGYGDFSVELANIDLPLSVDIQSSILLVLAIGLLILLAASVPPFLLRAYIESRERWEQIKSEQYRKNDQQEQADRPDEEIEDLAEAAVSSESE